MEDLKIIDSLQEFLNKRINDVDKCYEKEIGSYQTDYGLNVSLLNKKEKEQLINKRNCLLVQKEVYKEILNELNKNSLNSNEN